MNRRTTLLTGPGAIGTPQRDDMLSRLRRVSSCTNICNLTGAHVSQIVEVRFLCSTDPPVRVEADCARATSELNLLLDHWSELSGVRTVDPELNLVAFSSGLGITLILK
ncbi:MAG: hypothetical protein JOY95_13485 [Silvibacterium sp.]|nr:hypothetical protein [Silvibacterium sp.]